MVMTTPALQPLLARVEQVFRDNCTSRDELGASVSIWRGEEEILALAYGFCDREQTRAWNHESMVPFWSATKGLSAACILHLLDHSGIALGDEVAGVWPEFARAGKGRVTFAQVLSHQAGLPLLDRNASIFDHAGVVAAIEEQEPCWEPGSRHGYHPRLFGFLLDEIMLRLTGARIGEYFRREFGDPLGLDAWIGLPEAEHDRVATLYPGRMSDPEGEEDFYRAFADPQSLTRRAFGSPAGLPAVSGMNAPEAWHAGWPALGGIGSARGLAKFYAMLAGGGTWKGKRYFSEKVLQAMSATMVSGTDAVFCMPSAFSAGFMKDCPCSGRRRIFGPSNEAFGHPGAGGSLAFADPENNLAFAYTMNQMSYGVLPGPRALDMVDALYGLGR
jgi:CubicO group peptidase (beta-lactamase class C family)